MNRRIVVVGSLNADFVATVDRFPAPGETIQSNDFAIFPGGKGANQAYGAARLGGAVTMIGRVGNDAQGELLERSLASVGVDVSGIERDATAATGTALITVDSGGQNQIVIVPGANATFTPEHLERQRHLFNGAAIVLLQLEIPLATVKAAALMAKSSGAIVILDPAPAQPLSDEILELVDFLTPNETELNLLLTRSGGDSPTASAVRSRAEKLLVSGVRNVLIKMGPHGAMLISKEAEYSWPSFPVKAVDTTAAGDSFNAAFAVALASGKNVDEAGRFACAAAAISVTRRGAQPSMPDLAEVTELMAQSQ